MLSTITRSFCLFMYLMALQSISQADSVVMASLHQAPIQFEEDGEVKGIAVDISREIFKRMDLKVEIQLFPFARVLHLAQNSLVDAIFTIVKTEERETFLSYPDEVFLNQQAVMIVRKDDPVIFNGDFSNLSHHVFGVLHAATYGPEYEAAKSAGEITHFETVVNYKQSIQMLMSNRTDVMIGPKLTLLYAVKEMGYSDEVRVLSPAIQDVATYVAFTSTADTPAFLDRFDDTLRELKADGTYDRIIQSYIE